MGALAIFGLESQHNPAVGSLGDALWWAVVTATTVGYGDVSPLTSEGRIVAVFLMLSGIGVIGVFTATLASFFLENDAQAGDDIAMRLSSVEHKLDQLLLLQRSSVDSSSPDNEAAQSTDERSEAP